MTPSIFTHVLPKATSHIRGTVQDENGDPVYNAYVDGSVFNDNAVCSSMVRTDQAGQYSLPVIAGNWRSRYGMA